MTAQEMIKHYKIELVGENIRILNVSEAKNDDAIAKIKAMKPEIVACLKAQIDEKIRAANERKERIDSIEGLNEIRHALDDVSSWRDEFNKSFDDVGGSGVRSKPVYDLDALYAKYPRAKAYLDAENLSLKSNYELSAIGDKAKEMVLYGDWTEAVNYMASERKAFAARHMWD